MNFNTVTENLMIKSFQSDQHAADKIFSPLLFFNGADDSQFSVK